MSRRQEQAGRAARSAFRRHFLWPLSLLLGALGLSLLSSVFWLTMKQDELQFAAERQQVRMAVRSRMEAMRRNLGDYAVWDEALHHLVLRFDRAWAIENISPYLYRAQQYDYIAVVDGDGVVTIASDRGALTDVPPAVRLGAPFVTALKRLRMAPEGSDRRLVGLTRMNGVPAYFGVATIVASTVAPVPRLPDKFMVFARSLDTATLADLGDEFGIEALHSDTRGQANHLKLVAPPLGVVGTLGWEPANPGATLRARVLPGLVIIILLMIAIGYAVLRHARSALINAILSRREAEIEIRRAHHRRAELERTRQVMADQAQEAGATLRQSVARIEAEHEEIIKNTIRQRRDELIRASEDYHRAVKLVLETLEEASEALADVAGQPCGEISATQFLASAGDLQAQSQFLDIETRQFLARMRAA